MAEQLSRDGVAEEVSQLTPELLKEGAWRTKRFRKYTISLRAPRIAAGKRHPYREFLDLVKLKLVSMGFQEMRGTLVETEFWNMDALFMPQPETMYAPDHATWVEVPELSRGLCGLTRPVHFRGVCTVVLKLFMLTGADVAVFGQKDWQQQAILRRMVRDLDVPVRIETRETVRETDGLALSSRNVYLSADERARAPEIRKALLFAQKLAQSGETSVKLLREAVLRRWAEFLPMGRLDYLSIVHPESMTPLTEVNGPALMACAVRLGKARLIDNILLRS